MLVVPPGVLHYRLSGSRLVAPRWAAQASDWYFPVAPYAPAISLRNGIAQPCSAFTRNTHCDRTALSPSAAAAMEPQCMLRLERRCEQLADSTAKVLAPAKLLWSAQLSIALFCSGRVGGTCLHTAGASNTTARRAGRCGQVLGGSSKPCWFAADHAPWDCATAVPSPSRTPSVYWCERERERLSLGRRRGREQPRPLVEPKPLQRSSARAMPCRHSAARTSGWE